MEVCWIGSVGCPELISRITDFCARLWLLNVMLTVRELSVVDIFNFATSMKGNNGVFAVVYQTRENYLDFLQASGSGGMLGV